MKTIEERAQIAGQVYQFGKERIEADHKVYENGYIQGATEQKDIDIENACKACENELRRLKTLIYENTSVPVNFVSVGKSLSRIRLEMLSSTN